MAQACFPVELDLVRNILRALTKQVRQDIRAHLARLDKGFFATSSRNPDRKLCLDRGRKHFDRDLRAGTVFHLHNIALPQLLHRFDIAKHHLFAPLVVLGKEGEIIGMPARGKGQANATMREVINNRPLFGHAQRIMQREHDTASTQLHMSGHRCQCGTCDGWVGIEAAKAVKMSFGSPDGGKCMLVSKLSTLYQEVVAICAYARFLVRKVEQAKIDLASGCMLLSVFSIAQECSIPEQDHFCTSDKGPEQFQHGDIKGDTCQCQHRI
jgi:hypothetical protein